MHNYMVLVLDFGWMGIVSWRHCDAQLCGTSSRLWMDGNCFLENALYASWMVSGLCQPILR